VVSAGVQPLGRVQPRPKARASALPRKSILALGLLLLAGTAAVYLQVHRHPFFNMDDSGYVSENPHVTSGLNWTTVSWALTTYDDNNWHPLTWISHALDCQLFGLAPAGPHDVNLALHLINVVLLFWVLWKATGYAGRSLMVAALFALHPLNVESVAWIAERKTMLSMLFFLLALGAYRWYAYKPRMGRYIVVALLFVLALMSKPQAITFPCVLLLWDYWPLGRLRLGTQQSGSRSETDIPPRSLYQLVREKVPLFVLCLIDAYLTMRAQRVGRAAYWPFTFPVRLENAIVAYARYVQKMFWPSDLAPMYLHPGSSIRLWQVFAALSFLLAVTALVAVCWRRRYLTVGWLWFLGSMVPMIGLMQVGRQSMADRYAYLPFLGLFIMLCWGVADWAQARHLPGTLLPTVALAVLASLAVLTYRQVRYWADNVTLWSHTLRVTDRNWVAEVQAGAAFLNKGQAGQAAQHYSKALAINPTCADANLGIAVYEHETGHLRESIPYYEKFLAAPDGDRSQRYRALANLGHVYRRLGDAERARQYFDEAAKVDPTLP
jgi:tetratricopeptide (TPR) repeat protein